MKQFSDIIDNIPDNVWIYVIRHSNDFSWNFLAMKIILTRLNLKIVMFQDADGILQQCCAELRNLLKKSTNIPNAQKDLKQILEIQKG